MQIYNWDVFHNSYNALNGLSSNIRKHSIRVWRSIRLDNNVLFQRIYRKLIMDNTPSILHKKVVPLVQLWSFQHHSKIGQLTDVRLSL